MQIKIKNQADLLKHLQSHGYDGNRSKFKLNSDNTIDVVGTNEEDVHHENPLIVASNISHCCHCGGKFVVTDKK